MKRFLPKKTIQFLLFLSFVVFNFIAYPHILFAIDLDLTVAQNSVGKRFASKFCEAKKGGLSSESSSEFALNNTYLKFVAFPDDDKYLNDLWFFTLTQIREDCGEYLSQDEENNLRDFFKEEGEIASNRELYLPN